MWVVGFFCWVLVFWCFSFLCLTVGPVFCFVCIRVVLYSLTVQWEQSACECSVIISCRSLVFSHAFQCMSQNRMRILQRGWGLRQSPHVTKAEAVEKAAILNSESSSEKIQPGKHRTISYLDLQHISIYGQLQTLWSQKGSLTHNMKIVVKGVWKW